MSMVEKFLKNKNGLVKQIEEIRDAALKVAAEKADEMIGNFVDDFKAKIAEASDAEFIEFITSGRLEDDDINAAVMFRAEARKHKEANENKEPDEKHNENHETRVRVFVFDRGLI